MEPMHRWRSPFAKVDGSSDRAWRIAACGQRPSWLTGMRPEAPRSAWSASSALVPAVGRERHVIARLEHGVQGADARCIATSLSGEAENRIKEAQLNLVGRRAHPCPPVAHRLKKGRNAANTLLSRRQSAIQYGTREGSRLARWPPLKTTVPRQPRRTPPRVSTQGAEQVLEPASAPARPGPHRCSPASLRARPAHRRWPWLRRAAAT